MSAQVAANYSTTSPQEYLESCKDQRICVSLQGNIDIEGTLSGWDSFSNLLLNDVIETTHTATGTKTAKVDKIFLVSMRILTIAKGPLPAYVEIAQDA